MGKGIVSLNDGLLLVLLAGVGMGSCTVTGIELSPNLPRPPVTIPVAAGSFSDLEQSVHQQVNQYRYSQGLPPLSRDPAIDEQSRRHAEDMAAGQVPFGHDGFEGRVEAIGKFITYSSAAENVAYNQGYSDPATQAVEGWLDSPGHWENIVGDYNLTGIGIAQNDGGEYYFTQIFIRN